VTFTIVNRSADPIYYTYGCEFAVPLRLEAEGPVELTTKILESIPEPTTLPVGASHSCRWDQRVWQDPSKPGRDRFRHSVELALVTPGEYQLRLTYYRDPSEVHLVADPSKVCSSVFSVQ